MSDMPTPPLSTASPLPPPPPLRSAPPPPPVKKPRVFKVAHDITEPDVPVVEPVIVSESAVDVPVPVVATAVEPVEPVEPAVPAVPVPVDFDHEVEMWRGIELPPITTKAEEKEDDDMPPLISVGQLPPMPPLDDCTDMPPLEDHHNEADDEGEPPQVEEEEAEEEEDEEEEEEEVEEEEEKPAEDCQFLHDESETIDGELESFSKRIYNALTDINNVLFTAFASVVIGFILVNTFDNRVINNLNEL
jgi:hypothetical protein